MYLNPHYSGKLQSLNSKDKILQKNNTQIKKIWMDFCSI